MVLRGSVALSETGNLPRRLVGAWDKWEHHSPACRTSGTPLGFVLTIVGTESLKPRKHLSKTVPQRGPHRQLCTRRSASQVEHVNGHLLCVLNSADSARANVFSSSVMFFPGSSTGTVTHVLVGDRVTTWLQIGN
jgi:hypothetical protein